MQSALELEVELIRTKNRFFLFLSALCETQPRVKKVGASRYCADDANLLGSFQNSMEGPPCF